MNRSAHSSSLCSQCKVNPVKARGCCKTCYARLRKQGKLDTLPRVPVLGPDTECKVPECKDKIGYAGAKGLCPKHYQRLKNTGSLELPKSQASDEERFRRSVNPRGSCECGCQCERWNGGISTTGYGHFSIGNKTYMAHRVSWELANKQEIPEGLVIDHVRAHGCVHTDCVRSDHLEAVSYSVNRQRAICTEASEANRIEGLREGLVTRWERNETLQERFARQVSQEPCSCGCTCKRWSASVNKKTGYGTFSLNGVTVVAHRVSWTLANDWEVPEGSHIDHVAARGCVHRDCVNPDHLEAVTPKINAQRGKMGTRRAGAAAARFGEQILELLGEEESLLVRDIRKRIGASQTMTYSYLKPLLADGKVTRDDAGYYRLSGLQCFPYIPRILPQLLPARSAHRYHVTLTVIAEYREFQGWALPVARSTAMPGSVVSSHDSNVTRYPLQVRGQQYRQILRRTVSEGQGGRELRHEHLPGVHGVDHRYQVLER